MDTEKSEGIVVLPLTQLHFLRTLVEFSCNEKGKGMKGGIMKEKDFRESQINDMLHFAHSIQDFMYILDLEGIFLL